MAEVPDRIGGVGTAKNLNIVDTPFNRTHYPHYTPTYIQIKMANGSVNMNEIHRLLSMQAGLSDVLPMEDAMRFVRLAASLKRHIIHVQKSAYDESFPPLVLPAEINQFLGNAINLSTEFVDGCWKAFRETAWAYTSGEHDAASDARVFNEHGRMYCLGMFYK